MTVLVPALTERRFEVEEGTLLYFSSQHVLRWEGRRFGVVVTPAGFWTNRGPGLPRERVERSEAHAYPLPVVLDQRGGTARESREMTEAGTEHEVHDGDQVVFDTGLGLTGPFEVGPLHDGVGEYRRVRPGREYLELTLL